MASPIFGNLTFPAVRARINEIFQLLDTKNAGATAPTDYAAYSWWLDTSGAAPLLKFRDGSNSSWVDFRSFVPAYSMKSLVTLTSGSGATYTPSAGTRAIIVEVFGASGGGGGVDGQGAGTLAIGQAGGNGSYARRFITNMSQTFTYTIGAKGMGGAAGANNGTAGGTTSFVGSVTGTIQVTGGAGGTGTLGIAFGNVGQASPGVPTGGDSNVVGHRTVNVRWLDGLNYSFPNNGVPLLGNSQQTTSTGDGAHALSCSAGGMGAFVTVSTTNFAGGDGFRGEIIITEFS